MIISTIYDKDLKQKVFMVRDGERYTHSTKTSLNVEYNNSRKDYINITLTAKVQNHIGNSHVAFYDDETLLGVANCNQSDSEVTLTVNLEYGIINFHAKYIGNSSCLSSKSGIVELTVTTPNMPTPQLVVHDYIENVTTSTLNFTAELTHNEEQLSNKPVKLYIDNELDSTIIFDGTTVISNASALPIGQHVLTLVFEGDNEYLGVEYSRELNVGFNILLNVPASKIPFGEAVFIDGYFIQFDGTPASNREYEWSLIRRE